MTTPHSRFQQAFAKALFSPTEGLDPAMRELAAQPAFAVYRNTVMKACIDALEANFPTVARLVGSEWFRAAAALYVNAEAPQDGRLLHYGSGFAGFLRGFEPAAELVYLPGVAQLDTLWREAHVAEDAPAADAAWVARQSPEQMAALSLRPHPAARWAWFDDQPVFSIWERNRAQGEVTDELAWKGEGALLTRPYDAVAWQGLTQAGCVFLDACASGATLQQAAERAMAADAQADLAAIFAGLLSAGAFTAPSSSPASNERTP
ncbi:DNA-binding domain-containing protein [Variovorax sp. CCNWLW235]|uniref:DNA-binding domain-containing protein n=1 Tax=Variovorax sp. CCNWLW235 TaxID=3127463 RepID=UPI0030778EFE